MYNGHYVACKLGEHRWEEDKVKKLLKGILGMTFLVGMVLSGHALETVAPAIQRSPIIKIQPIEDKEVPTPPRGLSAIAGFPVQLVWDPSYDGITGLIGYKVYRDGRVIARVDGAAFRDADVKPGETHRYQVAALDGVENESALSNSVKVELPAPAPQTEIEAYSYPNPAVGGVAPVIRATVGNVDQIQVQIFDLSGRLVESGELHPSSLESDGRISYEFVWTGPISSGTYYGLVQGKAGDTTLRSRFMITVVR